MGQAKSSTWVEFPETENREIPEGNKCYICLSETRLNLIKSPCACSVAVHTECLFQFVRHKKQFACSICNGAYLGEQKKKKRKKERHLKIAIEQHNEGFLFPVSPSSPYALLCFFQR